MFQLSGGSRLVRTVVPMAFRSIADATYLSNCGGTSTRKLNPATFGNSVIAPPNAIMRGVTQAINQGFGKPTKPVPLVIEKIASTMYLHRLHNTGDHWN